MKNLRENTIAGPRRQKTIQTLIIAVMLLVAFGCQKKVEPPPPDHAREFTEMISSAHGYDAWQGKPVVQADFVINYNGKRIIDGRFAFLPSLGRIRAELKDDTVLVFDGQDAWVSPPVGVDTKDAMPMARFHLMTWPYFLAAPMKLNDDGTHVELAGSKPIDESMLYMPTVKLTFAPGTGDAPDDWYIIYRNPQTNRLAAMAYIVTYGQAKQEAEKKPHIVIYKNYKTIEGVTLPTKWTFYNWDEKRGAYGKPIGSATISNISFPATPGNTFEPDTGAVVDVQPGKK